MSPNKKTITEINIPFGEIVFQKDNIFFKIFFATGFFFFFEKFLQPGKLFHRFICYVSRDVS